MSKIKSVCLFSILVFAHDGLLCAADREDAGTSPNIVLIFTDDQGYGDVGCFGAKGYETPHLDQLATDGMRFTDFYVSQAVCGASRASLLTGCYSNRISMLGAPNHKATHGLNADEMTIAELLKQRDYATAIYGKWHLGHLQPFLPLQHGFDDYFGLPYSNDMWPYHATSKIYPPLPLLSGNEVANANVTAEDQAQLTTWYTEHALDFIDTNKERPFFLYVAHSMPHVPVFASSKHKGKTEQGLYGDVIAEIDWSVGQIVARLKQHGIEDNTLVIFTTDNGPWLSYGNHAGSAGSLREGKGTAWEGGARVPCIMKWPGRIPAGKTCDELTATIDILPTVAEITGADLSENRIDGKSILPLMEDRADAQSPHEAYYYYWGRELQAVRSGDWKLHFPHSYRSLDGPAGSDGKPAKYIQRRNGLELYNLAEDIGEQHDVASENPDVVVRLQGLAESMRSELGDSLQKRTGSDVRPAGRVEMVDTISK